MNDETFDIRQHFSALSEDVLLSRKDTAEVLGCKQGTLANRACRGDFDLAITMVGRSPKHRVGDIRSYIFRNRKGGQDE